MSPYTPHPCLVEVKKVSLFSGIQRATATPGDQTVFVDLAFPSICVYLLLMRLPVIGCLFRRLDTCPRPREQTKLLFGNTVCTQTWWGHVYSYVRILFVCWPPQQQDGSARAAVTWLLVVSSRKCDDRQVQTGLLGTCVFGVCERDRENQRERERKKGIILTAYFKEKVNSIHH